MINQKSIDLDSITQDQLEHTNAIGPLFFWDSSENGFETIEELLLRCPTEKFYNWISRWISHYKAQKAHIWVTLLNYRSRSPDSSFNKRACFLLC